MARKTMAQIALQATCPGCQSKIEVVDSANEIVEVTCAKCGKYFHARLPRRQITSHATDSRRAAKSPASSLKATSKATISPPDLLSANLPELQPSASNHLDWNSYRVRKPLVQKKPLLIALGSVAGLTIVVALTVLISQYVRNVDLNSVFSGNEPVPAIEKVIAEWKNCKSSHDAMVEAIGSSFECNSQMFALERLRLSNMQLLVRLILTSPAIEIGSISLPTPPDADATNARNYSSNQSNLTREFRKLSNRTSATSVAVLSFLHFTAAQAKVDGGADAENDRLKAKLRLCQMLARLHRGGDRAETCVAIYELAVELKKSIPESSNNVPQGVRSEHEKYLDLVVAALSDFGDDFADDRVAKSVAAVEEALR
jgi:transcription initiation factor TFIIIB Brf1 subunit/transcription initiation factor TFIIB